MKWCAQQNGQVASSSTIELVHATIKYDIAPLALEVGPEFSLN